MKKIMLLFLLWIPSFYTQAQDIGVYIKADGIYQTDFATEKKLNGGLIFKSPIVNQQGNYVAYTDTENKLYVQELNQEKYSQVVPVDKEVTDYVWSDGQLIFAKSEGGLFMYNPYDGSVTQLINTDAKYAHFVVYDGMLYGTKYVKLKLNHEEINQMVGIVEVNLSTLVDRVLLPYVGNDETKTDIEALGFVPQVAKLSDDGDVLYIWCKVNSGSLNADRVGLGYYDLKKNEFVEVKSVGMLGYSDQLDVNPRNAWEVVLINGEGRIMNENKQLDLLRLPNNELIGLGQSDMIYMTPSFSCNGNKVIFSAGAEQKGTYKPFTTGQNHIYELNLESKESRQLTFEHDVFDFYPTYLSNDSFVFIRRYSNKTLDLIKRDKLGKETIVASNLLSDGDNGYYGHLEIPQVLVIHCGGEV
ncbi:MAG TPA: hypothetical protein DCY20_09980 [Firmicutes bacterium]|nr:hypothetical protein [Bacillota bacterium]